MLSNQPVVHDRHLVKEIFHNMKRNNVHFIVNALSVKQKEK